MLKQFGHNYFKANLLLLRHAGHSKWQNIRHVKGQKDAERSALFTKLSRQMKVAVQEGGGSTDPKLNTKLSHVLEQANRFNMPAATVQSVLKSCQVDKTNSKTYMLEIKGPGGCVILCEVFTNKLHHVKMTLSGILKKHQSKLSESGALCLFQEKGIIEVETKDSEKSKEAILEIATDHAIECNAEEVHWINVDLLQFICSKSHFMATQKSLEGFGYKIINAGIEYIPLKLQDLSESDLELVEKLLGKLEEFPEVVRVFDNVNVL